MKQEARLLVLNAVDPLILSVEHFNRPSDRGRPVAVFLLLGHALEMLFKAAIVQRGAKITRNQTLSLRECLGKATSQEEIKFISVDQADSVRILSDLRDTAQHYLFDLSEQHLYVQVQAGFTLYRDIYESVFNRDLNVHLPERMLPISTKAPADIEAVFAAEAEEVRQLLRPGKRRRVTARAKLRGLAIVEGAIRGDDSRPSDRQLKGYLDAMVGGKEWEEVFPGVATMNLTATGSGPSLDLRITKKDGLPIHLVSADTPGSSPIAFKKVDSLGYYTLGRNDLSKRLGITGTKTSALIWHLTIKEDDDCFRRVTISKSTFDRYSQRAVERLREALSTLDIDTVWTAYRARQRGP